ncbi:transcriptional regulator [Caballeronia hypogeia]|uniref:Transcriptional regulator n=1 Tax=Caballeronia hypogeia TaxID=1777140 RepID=A0A157ZK17_9BURK|nr:ROK family protein [Caballeronia hypogeia]SAK45853.1 transcriptional regulator [Caballeronia hypogeia]
MSNKQSRHQHGYNGPRVRDLNRALVLEAIRQEPGIARADIAAATRLTAATITNIVAALIGEGAVEESVDREVRTTGQPVRSLRIIADYASTIGLHFDHEFATGVLVDVAGNVIHQVRQQLSVEDPERAVGVLAKIHDSLSRHPRRGGNLLGVGVSVMGPIDNQRGLVCQSAEYPAWREFGFRDALAKRIDSEIHIENNGTAAGLGEYWFGDGQRLGSYIHVFIGNGLGGALLMNRRAVRGLTGNGCEIGHVNAYKDGKPCFCGARGCLETVVSLRGLAHALGRDHAGELDLSALGERPNKALMQWIEQAGADLGRVLASVSNIVDVTDIVINGMLPPALLGQLIERARSSAAEYEMNGRPGRLALHRGRADSEVSAALGAATMPLYSNLF